MKTKMMVRICGAALAGLFAMGGVVAVPEVSPSTAMEVEAAVNPDAVNNTYYDMTCYGINTGRSGFGGDWYPANSADQAVADRVKFMNETFGDTYVAVDLNKEFFGDPVWQSRYIGPLKSDGTYTYHGFQTYYNDMVASYPQLKTQIKNGWRDLSYNGIQKLIAAKVLPADCLVGRYSKAGAATTTALAAATAATASTDNIKKLQAAVVELTVHPATVYNGVDYSKEFNAAYYYIANSDLQTAIGVNAQGLLQHYVTYGKKEGRLAIAK